MGNIKLESEFWGEKIQDIFILLNVAQIVFHIL